MRGGGGVPAHASLHDELGGEHVGMFHRESRCLPSFILAPIVCKTDWKMMTVMQWTCELMQVQNNLFMETCDLTLHYWLSESFFSVSASWAGTCCVLSFLYPTSFIFLFLSLLVRFPSRHGPPCLLLLKLVKQKERFGWDTFTRKRQLVRLQVSGFVI